MGNSEELYHQGDSDRGDTAGSGCGICGICGWPGVFPGGIVMPGIGSTSRSQRRKMVLGCLM